MTAKQWFVLAIVIIVSIAAFLIAMVVAGHSDQAASLMESVAGGIGIVAIFYLFLQ